MSRTSGTFCSHISLWFMLQLEISVFISYLSVYLKVSAFISLHHLSCPQEAQSDFIKKHPNISQCIHFTFPQYFAMIKPFTSKHRLTFKVKLSFRFCCLEHRVEAVQTIGMEFPLYVYQLALSAVWEGGVPFHHLYKNADSLQTILNQLVVEARPNTSSPLSFSLWKHIKDGTELHKWSISSMRDGFL